MTPARFTVGIIIATIILGFVFRHWLGYLLLVVFVVLFFLILVAVGLALGRRPVDTLALKVLSATLVLWLGPGTFGLMLEGLGTDVGRFDPYVTRAAWFGSMRATVPFWGTAVMITIITYGYRFRRSWRADRIPDPALSLLLLTAGLPGWILLPTYFLVGEGKPEAVGIGLFAPLVLATCAIGRLGFRAIDRELSHGALASASLLATAMALTTFVFLAVSWLAGDEMRGVRNDFWGTHHWDLLQWHQLGWPLVLLAMVWLLLGAWLGRQWLTMPIPSTTMVDAAKR